jgi:hypothetical protein
MEGTFCPIASFNGKMLKKKHHNREILNAITFTAVSIKPRFLNPVNPHILLLGHPPPARQLPLPPEYGPGSLTTLLASVTAQQ